MKRRVKRFPAVLAKLLGDDSGATVIEYTLIASIISIGIIVSAGSVGTAVGVLYTNVADEFTAAMD
ncbi:Flp family type IVb pilin [Phyllobacterium sp. YR531]|uniref:Flp family type IVb pilin n=1 Tax=Phyllobacterium sp. YR531 TaxID=1144343 RepID=UPI00026F8F93|nr:Flp family type IVb pilin [Phyllobacterium sp. YR531]EJN05290.1 Flp pilus assembly protein, pilin Flp [Phyllobacterium sp. YR531]